MLPCCCIVCSFGAVATFVWAARAPSSTAACSCCQTSSLQQRRQRTEQAGLRCRHAPRPATGRRSCWNRQRGWTRPSIITILAATLLLLLLLVPQLWQAPGSNNLQHCQLIPPPVPLQFQVLLMLLEGVSGVQAMYDGVSMLQTRTGGECPEAACSGDGSGDDNSAKTASGRAQPQLMIPGMHAATQKETTAAAGKHSSWSWWQLTTLWL